MCRLLFAQAPINRFQLVQQSIQQVIRAYYPRIYTVIGMCLRKMAFPPIPCPFFHHAHLRFRGSKDMGNPLAINDLPWKLRIFFLLVRNKSRNALFFTRSNNQFRISKLFYFFVIVLDIINTLIGKIQDSYFNVFLSSPDPTNNSETTYIFKFTSILLIC